MTKLRGVPTKLRGVIDKVQGGYQQSSRGSINKAQGGHEQSWRFIAIQVSSTDFCYLEAMFTAHGTNLSHDVPGDVEHATPHYSPLPPPAECWSCLCIAAVEIGLQGRTLGEFKGVQQTCALAAFLVVCVQLSVTRLQLSVMCAQLSVIGAGRSIQAHACL